MGEDLGFKTCLSAHSAIPTFSDAWRLYEIDLFRTFIWTHSRSWTSWDGSVKVGASAICCPLRNQLTSILFLSAPPGCLDPRVLGPPRDVCRNRHGESRGSFPLPARLRQLVSSPSHPTQRTTSSPPYCASSLHLFPGSAIGGDALWETTQGLTKVSEHVYLATPSPLPPLQRFVMDQLDFVWDGLACRVARSRIRLLPPPRD